MKARASGGACTKWGAKVPRLTITVPRSGGMSGTSWPVQAGHPCFACAADNNWDVMGPIYSRLPNVPGAGYQLTADRIGLGRCSRGGNRNCRPRGNPGNQGQRAERTSPSRRNRKRIGKEKEMPKIAIDPITRIEGHLRIEAQVDGGKVTDAWSSGTMWRGIEIM